jgi:hypothetical protein
MDFPTFQKMIEKMLKTLSDAQKERPKRQNWDKDKKDPDWVYFERQTMFDAVNRERRERDLPPVTEEVFSRAESNACGHSDYSRKFALYCAELVRDGKIGPVW